ncbi:hypothetical protein PYCC9005_002340 [Savitreella phatthalungensis]
MDALTTLAVIFLPIVLPRLRDVVVTVQGARVRGDWGRPVDGLPAWRIRLCGLGLVYHVVRGFKIVWARGGHISDDFFTLTGSRITVPVDVLRNRLAALNIVHSHVLTDSALWTAFESIDGRLIHLNVGEALRLCEWCTLEEPNSWLVAVGGMVVVWWLWWVFVVSLMVPGSSSKTPWVGMLVGGMLAELYARGGAFNLHNATSNRVSELVPVDGYAAVLRHVAVGLVFALLGLHVLYTVKFKEPEMTHAQIRAELVKTIERLRCANTAARTIASSAELDAVARKFWQKQREHEAELDRNPRVLQARAEVVRRLESELEEEANRFKEFFRKEWTA